MFASALMLVTAVVEGVRVFFQRENLESPSGEQYTIVKDLGAGSFGQVVLAKGRRGKYAIKKVPTNGVAGEKITLRVGSYSPYLVGLKESFTVEAYTFLVMEYANGGSLYKKLQSSGRLSIDTVRMFAAEIAVGLQFLHNNNIIYRDLKPGNILLHKGHIKLADFGLAKVTNETGTGKSVCGTPFYMAPEVLVEEHYSFKVDWWSCGVVVYEMLLGIRPFLGTDIKEVFRSILWGDIYYPPSFDPIAESFIGDLLQRNPRVRNGWHEVRVHPFLDIVHKKGKKYHVAMRGTL